MEEEGDWVREDKRVEMVVWTRERRVSVEGSRFEGERRRRERVAERHWLRDSSGPTLYGEISKKVKAGV
jgi:hypothetical protein